MKRILGLALVTLSLCAACTKHDTPAGDNIEPSSTHPNSPGHGAQSPGGNTGTVTDSNTGGNAQTH